MVYPMGSNADIIGLSVSVPVSVIFFYTCSGQRRGGRKLPAAVTSSEFTRNVWQARRNNPHSSNGVVKQTCRHCLRHMRRAINKRDG